MSASTAPAVSPTYDRPAWPLTIKRMDPNIDVAGVLEINAGAFERR